MTITVVKCGGDDDIDVAGIAHGVAALRASGDRVVLAHGGAREISRLATELDVPERTLTSPDGLTSRYTDDALLAVIVEALLGRVKPRLLTALAAAGVPAVGLSGLDGGLLTARRKAARRSVTADGRIVLVRDDRSGRITAADPTVLRALLDAGLVPVVSPPARDESGAIVNVDADRAAAAIAGALHADRLFLLTAAPGVLADPDDEASVLSVVAADARGLAGSAGMHRKLVAAEEALRAGVGEVRIVDGRAADPVAEAVAGSGTAIVADAAARASTPEPPGGAR